MPAPQDYSEEEKECMEHSTCPIESVSVNRSLRESHHNEKPSCAHPCLFLSRLFPTSIHFWTKLIEYIIS